MLQQVQITLRTLVDTTPYPL